MTKTRRNEGVTLAMVSEKAASLMLDAAKLERRGLLAEAGAKRALASMAMEAFRLATTDDVGDLDLDADLSGLSF